MWKRKKKEQKKEQNLLKDLCGDDGKLYDLLSTSLYMNPLTAISKKDLDIIIEEAEKSGNFSAAVDKAIFEATQNPGERERYTKVIQNLLPKTIHVMEQEKKKAEKEGNTNHAAYLGSKIEKQKFINERAEEVINVASEYYNEMLVGLGEDVKRKAREDERVAEKREEERIEEREKAEREASKAQRKGVGREEKREAKKQDKREELAAKQRKEVREDERRAVERKEVRIGDQEKAEREARREAIRKERSEN
jgi:hypothetical protein